jgi:hypothetical protein
VGGSAGTLLAGRIILDSSYQALYLAFGTALFALAVAAAAAIPRHSMPHEGHLPAEAITTETATRTATRPDEA